MTDRELISLSIDMQKRSYVPYSHFPVGAALLCEDGTVFTGCNVENAAYGSTICAERTALVKAVSEGYTKFSAIAISGQGDDYCWPCGSCRQMLFEFSPNMKILAARRDGQFETATLAQLLPRGFGPHSLEGA